MGKSSNLVDSPLPNAALSGQGFALHGVEQWGMNVLIHSLIEAQDLQKTMIVSSRYWICTLHSIRIYQDLGCVSFKNVQKQEDSNFPNKSRSFRDIPCNPWLQSWSENPSFRIGSIHLGGPDFFRWELAAIILPWHWKSLAAHSTWKWWPSPICGIVWTWGTP